MISRVVEVLHPLRRHKRAGPAQVLAAVVCAGIGPQPIGAEQDAAERQLVPARQPVRAALFLPQQRVKVLTGLSVPDLLEPGEMIEPACCRLDLFLRQFEQRAHLLAPHEDAVAHARHLDLCQRGHRLHELGLGIAVVDQPCLGAQLLHGVRYLQQGAHVAQGVKHSARPAVLAVDLCKPIHARDVKILRPALIAVDLEGGDHKICAVDCGAQVSRRSGRQLSAELFGTAGRKLLHTRQPLWHDVHQPQVDRVARQHLTQQDVANRALAKDNASRADNRNRYFVTHFISPAQAASRAGHPRTRARLAPPGTGLVR